MTHQIKGWSRILIFWLALFGIASAHSMQMIRCELSFEQSAWTADVWLEGWALYPEYGRLAPVTDPRNPGATGPAWMARLDGAAWRQMKEIGDAYLHETFRPSLAGHPLHFQISYPDLDKKPPTFLLNQDGNALVQCRLSGPLPAKASGPVSLSWNDPEQTPLAVTIRGSNRSSGTEPLEVLRLSAGTQERVVYTIHDADEAPVKTSALALLGWIHAGVIHIVPKGLDHILFILGLFFLQPKLKPLLAQASVFTVAHSLTLALVVLDQISISSRIVEGMIALSIAYVGFENLWLKELNSGRLYLVFGLGLLHGMGFASVMKELDIPQGSILQPLIGFNLGVELGQIIVLLCAFTLTFWAIKRARFERFRKIASALIGATGLYWTVQRFLG